MVAGRPASGRSDDATIEVLFRRLTCRITTGSPMTSASARKSISAERTASCSNACGRVPLTLLPLIPVLQVAWAEGGVSAAERTMIIDLARSRDIAAGSAADAQLQDWLEEKPSDATFRKASRLIAAMLDHPAGAEMQVSADDLMKYCEQIAHASGGLFGIGKVSAGEKAALQQIAAQLKAR